MISNDRRALLRQERQQARDPATPPSVLLLDCVERHPREVSQNPALPLIALEQPEIWRELFWKLSRHQQGARLRALLRQARIPARLLFAAECGARLLPLVESLPALHALVARAAETKRRAARGECSVADLAEHEIAPVRWLHRGSHLSPRSPLWLVGVAVSCRADRLSSFAAHALGVCKGTGKPEIYFPCVLAEMAWQEARLRAILAEPPALLPGPAPKQKHQRAGRFHRETP